MVKRNVEQDMVLSSKIVGVNHASKFLSIFLLYLMVSEKTGNVSSFLSFVDLSNFELTLFITNHFFHGLTYWNICTKLGRLKSGKRTHLQKAHSVNDITLLKFLARTILFYKTKDCIYLLCIYR